MTSAALARARRPPSASGPAGVLAGAALALGAIGPVLHETRWTGLSQRLLWVTLLTWLLVTAWQLTARPTAIAAARMDELTRPG